jgi:hypothetical protein
VAETAVVGCTGGLSTAELAAALDLATAPADVARIDRDRLERVARFLANWAELRHHQPARWDDPRFWNVEADDAARSQYLAVGNAINFRFWDKRGTGPIVPAAGIIDGERFRGAMYMWRGLRRTLDGGRLPLLDAGFLSRLSEEEFDAIFTDDSGVNPLEPGKPDRVANLRDLGAHLRDHWDGSFYNLVQSSDGSLVRFAQLSKRLRAFDDPVLKLTMVNAILHSGSGIYRFRDQPLPGIDYHLLRHLLRQRVLAPAPEIAEKLMAGSMLTEIEGIGLRRTALVAFVELSRLSDLSGEILDNRYWLNRSNCGDAPVCLNPKTADSCPFLEVCARDTRFGLPLEYTRYY